MHPGKLPRLPGLLLSSPDPQRRRTHDDILQGASLPHLSHHNDKAKKTADKAVLSVRRVGNGGRRIEMEGRSKSRHSGPMTTKKRKRFSSNDTPKDEAAARNSRHRTSHGPTSSTTPNANRSNKGKQETAEHHKPQLHHPHSQPFHESKKHLPIVFPSFPPSVQPSKTHNPRRNETNGLAHRLR